MDLGSAFSNFSNIGQQMVVVIYLVFIGLILLGVVFIFLVIKRYNVNVIILQKTGKSLIQHRTKGGVFAKKKYDPEKFYLQKFKNLDCEPPEKEYYYIDKRGKPCVMLYMKDEKTIVPLKINAEEQEINPVDYKGNYWLALKSRENNNRYSNEGFWDKYGGIVIVASAMVFAIVMFVLTYKYMLDVSGQASAAASGLKEAVQALAEATKSGQQIK